MSTKIEPVDCSICLSSVYKNSSHSKNRSSIETECGHLFHSKCLQPSIKDCPNCRKPLKDRVKKEASNSHEKTPRVSKPDRQAAQDRIDSRAGQIKADQKQIETNLKEEKEKLKEKEKEDKLFCEFRSAVSSNNRRRQIDLIEKRPDSCDLFLKVLGPLYLNNSKIDTRGPFSDLSNQAVLERLLMQKPSADALAAVIWRNRDSINVWKPSTLSLLIRSGATLLGVNGCMVSLLYFPGNTWRSSLIYLPIDTLCLIDKECGGLPWREWAQLTDMKLNTSDCDRMISAGLLTLNECKRLILRDEAGVNWLASFLS